MALEKIDELEVAWEPSPGSFEQSPVGRMAKRHGLSTIEEVFRKASQDPNWYWQAASEDVGVRWLREYDEICDLSDGVEFPRFFAGGKLNWSDYAVDRWVDEGRGSSRAIYWEGDDGQCLEFTYLELQGLVNQAAGALNEIGVSRGDPVGIVLPMIPEAIVAMLAIARIGALAVPMFSGFGERSIRERVEHCGAKVMITCDGFYRRSKEIRIKDTVDKAIEGLGVETVLIVRRAGIDIDIHEGIDRWWDEEVEKAVPVEKAIPMDADDPCILLYTSGSTGRPKGCVHTHAGLPLKIAIESRHAFGLDEEGTMMWLTDMGWIMGSFVIAAALGNGATACFFEGTPDWPEPDRLWKVAKKAGVTVLGLSPTLIRSLMRHGDKWADEVDIDSLKVIASTGEPWNEDSWRWCFSHVGKGKLPIVNISGGTECGGGLVAGNALLPVKPMSFNGPVLGMRAEVIDDDRNPVREEVGELVVTAPWPGMTKSLWQDKDRYVETYWERFPGIWHHGDFAYVDKDGFWYILGRSDDTMNIAGKRVGPSEIESAIVEDEDVLEAAAVGVDDELKGEVAIGFVVLEHGVNLVDVQDRILGLVRQALGPAIVPKLVQIPELPKTRSGKIMRRVLRSAYMGIDLGDLSSLENPDSLKFFETLVRK